jgi:23S rRNA pseudouridine2605 synthase
VGVRLQKLLAAAGIASRREAEALVRAGRVAVNGRVASLGDSADPAEDRVTVDGEVVKAEPLHYWVVHKPQGVVTTRSDPEGRPTVLDLLPPAARRYRLVPVGRLDRESEGLVLLTNDGNLTHRMLHPSWGSEKEYRVTVRGNLLESQLHRLRDGTYLREGKTAPARVSAPRYDPTRDVTSFRIVLREGRKRQIRRTCAQLGHRVVRLVRIRVGPIELARLRVGEARALTAAERRTLRSHADALEKTGPTRKRRPRRSPARRPSAAGPRDPAPQRRKSPSRARPGSPKHH